MQPFDCKGSKMGVCVPEIRLGFQSEQIKQRAQPEVGGIGIKFRPTQYIDLIKHAPAKR